MAREYAQIRTDIWNDDNWRELPPPAQHLYMTLMSDPTLSACGVADWRPARIAARAADWTPAAVNSAATILAERLFIVVDEATEEVLIRSHVKHDGVIKVPNSSVTMVNAMAAVASKQLRGVLVHELRRLKVNQPTLAGWNGKTSGPKLADVLRREVVDPGEFPTGFPRGGDRLSPAVEPFEVTAAAVTESPANGSANPSAKGSVNPSVNGSGNPSVMGSGKGSANPSVTPLPITNTYTSTSNEVLVACSTRDETPEPSPEPEPKKVRGSRISESFIPSAKAIERMRAECPDVDLKAETVQFVDYWLSATGQTAIKRDWDRTWCNRMRDQQRFITERRSRWQQPRQTARERQFAEAGDVYRDAVERDGLTMGVNDPLTLLGNPYADEPKQLGA